MIRSLLHITFGLLVVMLTACGGKDIQRTQAEVKPAWVTERPFSPSDYIGIGIASKSLYPMEYAQIAKKNALNDLASEISVEVKGETFLSQLEVGRDFRETFMSQINTSTREKIEGYEVAGTWENGNEYWVFYRLSRSKHASVKAQKKRAALDSAKDYFLKGKDALTAGNIPQSVDMHLHALLEMKEYWMESNPYSLEGEQVFLDNEIYSSLRSCLSEIRIEPNFQALVLNKENNFVGRVILNVRHGDQPLRNVPVMFDYARTKYAEADRILTNGEGEVFVEMLDADPTVSNNVLHAWMDVDDLIGEVARDPLLDPIVKRLAIEQVNVPISFEMPTVFMQSVERQFGGGDGHNLSNSLRSSLTAAGWTFAASPGDADLLITLESDTRDGGMSQGFHVAYLELHITVTDADTGQVVFGQNLADIKGLHLNVSDASTEAYKKARKKIEKDIADQLMKQLL